MPTQEPTSVLNIRDINEYFPNKISYLVYREILNTLENRSKFLFISVFIQ